MSESLRGIEPMTSIPHTWRGLFSLSYENSMIARAFKSRNKWPLEFTCGAISYYVNEAVDNRMNKLKVKHIYTNTLFYLAGLCFRGRKD